MQHQCNPKPLRVKDLSNKRYGRLTVKHFSHLRLKPGGSRVYYWACECDCGNWTAVSRGNLKNGSVISCGCRLDEWLHGDERKVHGATPERLYRTWANILTRCSNPNATGWHLYGGRGIRVCDEWATSYVAFRDWALANGWQDDLEIDRIDVNGNYEPGNCRWTTDLIQARNKRSNLMLTANGETHCLEEWAQILGVPSRRIWMRLKRGWSHERALRTPLIHQSEQEQATRIEFNGRTMCIAEWAREIGVGEMTLAKRLRHGWSVERALTEPLDVTKRNHRYAGACQ